MKKYREMNHEEKKIAWAEIFQDSDIKGWFKEENGRLVYYLDFDHFYSVKLLKPEEVKFGTGSKTDEDFLVFTLNDIYHHPNQFSDIEFPNQIIPIGKKTSFYYLNDFFSYSWDSSKPGARQKKMNRHLKYISNKDPIKASELLNWWSNIARWNKSFYDHEVEDRNMEKYGKKKPTWYEHFEKMPID